MHKPCNLSTQIVALNQCPHKTGYGLSKGTYICERHQACFTLVWNGEKSAEVYNIGTAVELVMCAMRGRPTGNPLMCSYALSFGNFL